MRKGSQVSGVFGLPFDWSRGQRGRDNLGLLFFTAQIAEGAQVIFHDGKMSCEIKKIPQIQPIFLFIFEMM